MLSRRSNQSSEGSGQTNKKFKIQYTYIQDTKPGDKIQFMKYKTQNTKYNWWCWFDGISVE